MTSVTPSASGPYTTYEWPVTQPTSAVHQNTSESLRSKTHLVVAYTCVRYPPVVCRMPFGFPVVPDVYRMYSGSSASIASGGQSAAALDIKSVHHLSRLVLNDTVCPVRRSTTTCSIDGVSLSASSAFCLSG